MLLTKVVGPLRKSFTMLNSARTGNTSDVLLVTAMQLEALQLSAPSSSGLYYFVISQIAVMFVHQDREVRCSFFFACFNFEYVASGFTKLFDYSTTKRMKKSILFRPETKPKASLHLRKKRQ